MIGKELDGKQWVTGAKTRDNLIAEYRCAALPTDVTTSILNYRYWHKLPAA